MRSKIVALLLSSMLLAGIALAQTSTPSSSQLVSILYDDFNEPLIDPLRWTTGWACWSRTGFPLFVARTLYMRN